MKLKNFKQFHVDTTEFKGHISNESVLQKLVNVIGMEKLINLKANIAECDEIIVFGNHPESQSVNLTLKNFLGIQL